MNWLLALAALSGAVAVAAGAFGAHAATGDSVEWLKTGSHYQIVHALAALIAVHAGARGAGWLFVIGGAVFAGSLYLMAGGLPRWLGAITPIGGVLLIAGWLWFGWVVLRSPH